MNDTQRHQDPPQTYDHNHDAAPLRPDVAGRRFLDVNGNVVLDRFERVMSFHEPERLAAVADRSGAFHIRLDGQAAYAKRFAKTFGFYEGLAAVEDETGWYHIRADGQAAYAARFRWAGNFCEQRAPVETDDGFCHITPSGLPAYPERYRYVGDFRYGVAVAHTHRGAIHIRTDGTRLHPHTYAELDVYHKGVARARDAAGWLHVDALGLPCYPHRFAAVEPFYNDVALCRTHDGHTVRLHPSGFYTHLPALRPACTVTSLPDLHTGGEKALLFVRHAERPKIRSGWGDEVLLTDRGHAQARAFGRALAGRRLAQIFTSPIARCVQTAEGIASGLETPVAIQALDLLGDPGPFHDRRYQDLPWPPHRFSEQIAGYLEHGRVEGLLPLESACKNLLRALGRYTEAPLSIAVTHDLFVAGLLRFLGLVSDPLADWPRFLSGLWLRFDAQGKLLEWRRLVHDPNPSNEADE